MHIGIGGMIILLILSFVFKRNFLLCSVAAVGQAPPSLSLITPAMPKKSQP